MAGHPVRVVATAGPGTAGRSSSGPVISADRMWSESVDCTRGPGARRRRRAGPPSYSSSSSRPAYRAPLSPSGRRAVQRRAVPRPYRNDCARARAFIHKNIPTTAAHANGFREWGKRARCGRRRRQTSVTTRRYDDVDVHTRTHTHRLRRRAPVVHAFTAILLHAPAVPRSQPTRSYASTLSRLPSTFFFFLNVCQQRSDVTVLPASAVAYNFFFFFPPFFSSNTTRTN